MEEGCRGGAAAPDPPPEPLRRILEAIQQEDIAGTVKIFEDLKNSLLAALGKESGERHYYGILGKHGVRHSNEFRSRGPAKAAAGELWNAIEALEAGGFEGGGYPG